MDQNWIGIYNFAKEHQADLLREADRARAVEAARAGHRRAALRRAAERLKGKCAEQDASETGVKSPPSLREAHRVRRAPR